jgi:hypothetical protein
MKVTYLNPDFPDGFEFHLHNVITLLNGTPVEVSAEQLVAYEAASGMKFADAIKGNPAYVVGSAKGGE